MRHGAVSVQTARILLVWTELFAASRELCGGLTACVFIVFFSAGLKKISGVFTVTNKISSKQPKSYLLLTFNSTK